MSTPPPTIQTAILAQLTRNPLPRKHFWVVDMVTALLGLHRPSPGEMGQWCTHCPGDYAGAAAWPCDTVKVMAAALGLKEGDWR